MTTLSALQSSVENSRPLEVYEIVLGTDTFRFTTSEDEITVGTDTYTPESIERSAIVRGQDERTRLLEVQLPAVNEFAALYRGVVPGQMPLLTIYRLDRGETPTFSTQLKVFRGYVQGVRFPGMGARAIMGVQSMEGTIQRNMPLYTYQALCNHVLYSAACGADADSFKLSGTVSVVSGNTITVPGLNAHADGYWKSGYVKLNTVSDFRSVLDHVGNVLTLTLPFSDDVAGLAVDVFAGCDHVIDGDCQNKFNRVATNGGFAFGPTKNPFEKGL